MRVRKKRPAGGADPRNSAPFAVYLVLVVITAAMTAVALARWAGIT